MPGRATFWMDARTPVEPLQLRRAPLLAAALAFALGELLARQWQLPAILLGAAALLLLLGVLALRHSPRIALVPTLALWAVTGCWCAQIEPSPPRQIALRAYADGLSRTVRAHVTRIRRFPSTSTAATPDTKPFWRLEPGEWDAQGANANESVDLAVDAVEDVTPDTSTMRPAQGGIRLTVFDGAPTLTCGDTIEAPLRLRESELYRDPGAFSYADELLRDGITLQSSTKASNLHIVSVTQLAGASSQLAAGSSQLEALSPTHPLDPKPWALDPASLHCHLYSAQAWASSRLLAFTHSRANLALPPLARLTPDDAAMLNAMLFGDRTGLTHDLRLGFERTGSFHLFVVSGMHVALLAGLLFWLLRRLHTPQGLATLLTLAATAAYAALTGFGVPVQRALLMSAVFLTARWLWRDITILQAIGAAALAVLALDPRALTEASFQMTFLALIAVGGLAIPLAERSLLPRLRATQDIDALWQDARLPPHLAQVRVMLRLFGRTLAALVATPATLSVTSANAPANSLHSSEPTWMCHLDRSVAQWRDLQLTRLKRLLRHLPALALRLPLRVAELALVGLIVEACMAVPMAVYFHRATPFALPANILAVPLVAILAPLAILTFCTSLISSWLAAIPAAATALALHAISAVITTLSHARLADARVPGPAPLLLAAILLALAYACWAIRRPSRLALASGVLALALIPLAALWPEPPLLHPGTLEVTALDVGQGDSLLVVSPEGRTLLVDAGGPVGPAANPETANAANRWDVGEEVVAPYLWSRRLRRLDAVLLTHAHSDHMGGMPAILRDFRPRELWVSTDPADSADYQALLALAASLGIEVKHYAATDLFPWGGAVVTVLAPEPAYASTGAPVNDDSLVTRIDFGKSSVLLEGDAERPSEETMLANNRITPVTLLKVGHHGSRTSTNPDFLAAAAPQQAVISSGRRNTFGHPRLEILERLEQAHIKTFRTDRAGATTFLLTSDGRVSASPAQ